MIQSVLSGGKERSWPEVEIHVVTTDPSISSQRATSASLLLRSLQSLQYERAITPPGQSKTTDLGVLWQHCNLI